MKALYFVFSLLMASTLVGQSFTEVIGTPFEGIIDGSVKFADLDGDGDQDLILTGQNSSTAPNAKLYLNDGSGNFTESVDVPFDRVRNSSIASIDVDGDADQDILITGINNSFSRIAKLYVNDGNAGFTESNEGVFTGAQDAAIAFADIDGDQDQDILIIGRRSPADPATIASKLYINDGSGSFMEMEDTPFEGVFNGSADFADIDGDDDQDVVITGENESDQSIAKLYKNNGDGTFAEVMDSPFTGVRSSAIEFADIDNDSDQDILITGWNSTSMSKFYVNDGTGNFIEKMDNLIENVSTGDIEFTDVDRDGDQDVFITGSGQDGRISKLYLNDGNGDFSEFVNSFDMVWQSSIAFADVDGDTYRDILITGENDSNQRISKLYRNGFMTSSSNLFETKSNDIEVYPNPVSTSAISIIYNSSERGLLKIEVVNIDGSTVQSREYQVGVGEQTLTLDVTSLHNGCYILQLEQRSGNAQLMLIVNR